MFLQTITHCLIGLTLVYALDNGAGLKPPLGWSSWCDLGRCGNDVCRETEVKAVAAAMKANGMQALGYDHIVLDDCWAATSRLPNGSITWDKHRFPSGMPALTEYLHSQGFKFGLYTSAGDTTCDNGGRNQSIPGSEGYYQQDANTFASWNLDYVKVDWCGDVHKKPLEGAPDYIAFSWALTHTIPARTMFFEGVASYMFLLGFVGNYVNSWRAGIDHHDTWLSTIRTIDTVAILGHQGTPGAWSYNDVLMTGGQGCPGVRHGPSHCPGQTDTEYVTEFTLWWITQSPLMVATDVRNMTSIMNKVLLNKAMLELHQDTRTPGGKYSGYDKVCSGSDLASCQYWTRPIFGNKYAVVLFNARSKTHNMTMPLSVIGWDNVTAVTATDLWTNEKHNFTTAVTAEVVKHGVVALLLSIA